MYKTSTFITSLFCKFKVKDKNIRKQVVDIYTPIIDTILNDVPSVQRVLLFKELLPSIQNTIKYLENSQEDNAEILDIIKTATNFSSFLISKVGLRERGDVNTFKYIMNQVNIEEIACEIGDCITELKKEPDDDTIIRARLDVLLHDYNSVMQQSLTIDDVLNTPVDEREL